MRKTLLICLLVLFVQSAICQIDTLSANQSSDGLKVAGKVGGELSEQELKAATQMYLAMTKTQAYKAAKEAMLEYAAKNPPKDIKGVEDLRTKVTWNLSATKFSSVDEAVQLYQRNTDLYTKQQKENKALYDLMSRASASQLKIIIQPEFSSVRSRVKEVER